MSHTDPIADLLTRIRNAAMVSKKNVVLPSSKIKAEIAAILKKEGYIKEFKVDKTQFPVSLEIELKYDNSKRSIIEGIERVSKPGRRVYVSCEDIPKVLGGLGVTVISTSKGILTGKDCKNNGIGGEVLLNVW